MVDPIRVEGSIPIDLPIRNNANFLFISRDQRAYTHALHKYPAKFFPELPRWAIERYSAEGETVLDPFTGSGTTNVEASLLNRNSIGIDVDPFSKLLTRVKTTPLSRETLLRSHQHLKRSCERYDEKLVRNGIPNFPYRDNWFKPYILKELAYISSAIESSKFDEPTKNFWRICLSSIIRSVSQADNNCTRTVIRRKLNKQVNPGDAISSFVKRMKVNVEGMLSYIDLGPIGQVSIPDGLDARNLIGVDESSVDLAVTSPPYLNAVDYPRTHQLELYWLGLAEGSLRDLKSQHVGTEVVSARDYQTRHATGTKADETIAKIYEIDPRRAFIASKYILDMVENLREVWRVLKPGKRYVLVVGNNTVRGNTFETWKYLLDVASQLGYKIDCHFTSGIINHFIKVPRLERIDEDHILVLQK